MNIWQWVHEKTWDLEEKGEDRLAEIIHLIPSYTVDDHHDKVDELFAEGVALARGQGEKWVELFLRHWHLQSQILKRNNALMLQEAVELLDFAHQEDNKQCPQRICVVQDLASCYAIKDGPGFVEERLQVALETLNEIDGSWPCYECVASEYNDALLDAEKYEEVLEACRWQAEETEKHGEKPGTGMALSKSRALLHLGRYDEALKLISNVVNEQSGEGFERRRALMVSLIHALCGRFEESIACCPPFDEVLASPSYYLDWIRIQTLLAAAGKVSANDPLFLRFHLLARNLINNGAIRPAILLLEKLAEAAFTANAALSAKIAVNKMAELVPQLNKDLGASETLARLQQRYEELEPTWHCAVPVESLEELLEMQFESKEIKAIAYEKALVQWPESEDVVIILSQIYQEYCLPEQGLSILEQAIHANPNHVDLQFSFGRFLIENFGRDRFLSVFDPIDPMTLSEEQRMNHYWLYAFAYGSSDLVRSYNYLLKFLELNPSSLRGNVYAARHADRLERHQDSIDHWNRVLTLAPEETQYHWDRLVPATLTEQWGLVRESAKALGMELQGDEGPVVEDWEKIRLQFNDVQGESDEFAAVRTGPVTAKVIGINSIGSMQRYGDSVVFNPEPLNELSETDEEGYRCDAERYYTLLFPALKTVESSGTTVLDVDGVHPGEEKIKELVTMIDGLGWALSQRSSDEYVLEDDHNNEYQGWYAYLVLPREANQEELKELNQLLQHFSDSLDRPLVWPLLLEKIGDEAALVKQVEIQDKYNM